MKIEIVPYNPLWPAQFESERSAIESSLGDILVQAHHIGSTAVEGLTPEAKAIEWSKTQPRG
jgi:GrpB-like predicted nucleotidyltransferase (UPF0157 family)